MFGVLIVVTALLQAPIAAQAEWAVAGLDAKRPAAVMHTGTVELTPADALLAARSEVEATHRDRVRQRGASMVRDSVPFWLPAFFAERALDRWVDEEIQSSPAQVLDRDDLIRDHGFGKSFQTRLLVDHQDISKASAHHLSYRIRNAGELFLAKCGGTAVLWTLLSLVFWWFDRITRGYMTGRLRLLAGAIGITIPAIAFLVV